MDINKNNYEAFFLDYHEGNLSAEQVAELMLFLEQHPGLKEEFESFENIQLEEAGGVVFHGKEQLKKSSAIGVHNCEEYFINSAEGNLSTGEEKALERFIVANPSLRKDRELYLKTILPAEKIVFEGKASLKRGQRVLPLYYYVSAAAAVLLAVGLYFLLRNESPAAAPQMAVDVKKENAAPGNEIIPSPIALQDTVGMQKQNAVYASEQRSLIKKQVAVQNIADTAQPEMKMPEKQIAFENDKKEEKKEEGLVMKEEKKKPEQQDTMPAMALNNSTNPDKYLSVKEFAATKIKQKVLGEAPAENETTGGRSRKLGLWEVARAAAKGIGKITGKESDVKPSYNEQGQLTGYTVTAGRFELERATTKKLAE